MSKLKTVKGLAVAPPRPTGWAYVYAVLWLGLPLIALLLLADVALWAFFRLALDRCYGVLCLLD